MCSFQKSCWFLINPLKCLLFDCNTNGFDQKEVLGIESLFLSLPPAALFYPCTSSSPGVGHWSKGRKNIIIIASSSSIIIAITIIIFRWIFDRFFQQHSKSIESKEKSDMRLRGTLRSQILDPVECGSFWLGLDYRGDSSLCDWKEEWKRRVEMENEREEELKSQKMEERNSGVCLTNECEVIYFLELFFSVSRVDAHPSPPSSLIPSVFLMPCLVSLLPHHPSRISYSSSSSRFTCLVKLCQRLYFNYS